MSRRTRRTHSPSFKAKVALAAYDIRRCDAAEGAEVDYSSSLRNDDGELVELPIKGERRHFLIAVVGADHRPRRNVQTRMCRRLGPPFLVIEKEASR